MANLKYRSSKRAFMLLSTATMLCVMAALAQTTKGRCEPAVVPLLGSEPPAKIVIDPPLPGPLASRAVVIIHYCAVNLHIAPVFGAGALNASTRWTHPCERR